MYFIFHTNGEWDHIGVEVATADEAFKALYPPPDWATFMGIDRDGTPFIRLAKIASTWRKLSTTP